MEGDEMEMSKEELQRWIRGEVKKSRLISPGVLEKLKVLKTLLEEREKLAANLLELCESVAACEEIVKKQYSLLGWEYKDTDSDDGENSTDCRPIPPMPLESVQSETQAHSSLTSNRPARLRDNENLGKADGKNGPLALLREPVVVLTRCSLSEIKALLRPLPQNHRSPELDKWWDVSNKSKDSDFEPGSDRGSHFDPGLDRGSDFDPGSDRGSDFEPGSDRGSDFDPGSDPGSDFDPGSDPGSDSDSDFSISNFNIGSNKRRKLNKKNNKSHATPQGSRNCDAKSNPADASAQTANTVARTQTSAPHTSANTDADSSSTKTQTPTAPPASTEGATPASNASPAPQPVVKATRPPPSLPQGEIKVDMNVVARRTAMSWQQGKVVETVTKENGKLKYKVHFTEKGKSLVSGHHIAFDCSPQVRQLAVGSRVAVKSQADQNQFLPGILAELPDRKNRMRFMVFVDDHTVFYSDLPSLRLVYRPLSDPLDDILDDRHRDFMKEYIDYWPYVPHMKYRVGHPLKAECNGDQQKCEVVEVDCSLIRVAFVDDQRKEWLFRGSMRIQHIADARQALQSNTVSGN